MSSSVVRRVAAAGTVSRNSECHDPQDQGPRWNGLECLEGRLLLDGGPTVSISAPSGYDMETRGNQISINYDATLDGPTAHVDFYSRIAPDFPTGPDFSVGSQLIGSQDLTASGSDTFVWDTSTVQPGMYFIEAVATDGTSTNPATNPATNATPMEGVVILSAPVGGPVATFNTSMGSFQVELDQSAAPLTVANFRDLVQSGFYNGLIFHRVISGFMDQAGGFDTTMTEKLTGYSSPNNVFSGIGLTGLFNENQASDTLSNVAGTIAMARTSDPNSATSEFFVNDVDNSGSLDADTSQDGVGYCVFGHVISGMDVIDAINAVMTESVTGADGSQYDDVPVTPIVIYSATMQDAVNTAPSFTTRPSATVWNGAGPMTIQQWVTSSSPGTGDESLQTLTYQVTNIDHPGLFDVAPTIDASGALSFTPNPLVAGTATITVVAVDNGGTDNGGQNTSAPVTFTITTSLSSPENTAPVAQPVTDSTLEGQDVSITLLGSDAETPQANLTYAIATQPAHGTAGIEGNVAYYMPDAGYAGPDSFTYVVTDDGIPYGSDFNVATSDPAAVSIDVIPVNAAPSFSAGENQSIYENAGAQTVTGWATNIDPGGPNESGQTLTFVASVSSTTVPGFFSVAPAISADGTLTYTVAPDIYGGATISCYLQDDGGTANGGQDTSPSQTFTIQVLHVNQAPSFTAGPDQYVGQDSGPQSVPGWATAISPGPDNEASQLIGFTLDHDDNPDLFTADGLPAISADGTLTYTPAPGVTGSASVSFVIWDNGGTLYGGVNVSEPQFITINVEPVNHAPSFVAGPNVAVMENDGPQSLANWATFISPGPAGESGQALTFLIVGNTNPALFAAQPSISADGTLTFTPVGGVLGATTITVELRDDGGTSYGGQDTSSPQTFKITVNDINVAPSFTSGGDQAVNENAGVQTVVHWATAISAGSAIESYQTVTLTVTGNSNPSLFAVAPSVTYDGTLTYTPAADAFGQATITVVAQDDGGTEDGGVDTSAPRTFTITVNPVNHAPSFTMAGDQVVNEDAGAQTVANWATGMSAGPANEAGQALNFLVTGDSNPSLFAVAPSVSSDGTLTFQSAVNAYGSATISLVLHDDGGTANGGVDTSAAQSFTITVNPVNHTPTAISQYVTVGDDAGVTITLSGSDIETAQSGLSYAIMTEPVHGTLTQLSNDTFRYEVGRSYAGTDIITFTVTDAGGPAGTDLGAQTSAAAAVYISGGIMKDFTTSNTLAFTGTTGAGLITLKNGTGSAFFGHSGVCDIGRIFLSGTGDKSTLTVASKTKAHVILLGGIDSSAALNSIVAPTLDISGLISIGKGSGVTLSFGKATGASIDTDSPIRGLTAASWLRSDDSTAEIQSPTLAKLTVAGDFSGDLAVDTFGGGRIGGGMTGDTLNVNGNVGKLTIVGNLGLSTWDVLGSTSAMSIGGDLTSTNWTVKGAIGALTVTGTADHSSLRSGRNMAAITVGASKSSDFLAGIDSSVARTPFVNTQFSVGATITSFTVKGLKGQALGANDFADSNLAAWNMGMINLLNGDFSTGAIRGASGGKITQVKYTDKANKANNWTYKPGGSLGAVPAGFIRLL